MQTKRLLRKTGIYFIGNLSSKILSILLVPLYAFYITAEQLGIFDYNQTLINVLIPISFIAIWEAVLKFLLSVKEDNKKVVSNSILLVIAQTVVITICVLIYNFFNCIEYVEYVLMMLLTGGITYVWQYYARGVKENKLYVKAGIIGTIVNFITNIILICIFDIKVESLYIGHILGNIAIFLTIELKLKTIKQVSIKKMDMHFLKRMICFSAPLVINLISVWLISGTSKIIITNILGKTQNGLYSFANKFSIIITFVGSVLSMAIIEEAILLANENAFDNKFTKTMQFIFEKFISIIILALPIINIFYYFIKETEYYPSRYYFPFLLFYALLMNMSTNIGSAFQALNKTKYISITSILGSTFTIVISLLFINKIGIYAVLIGQLVGSILIMITRYIFVTNIGKIKIKWDKIFALTIIYMIIAFICFTATVYINIVITILLTLIIIYLNRDYIFQFIDFIRKEKKYD
ncbi:MAG: oligosaccharide flippase family protein [Clostridia bacterium]|nr:oligosaccharide flippase family protein [Clostridia bacterium]